MFKTAQAQLPVSCFWNLSHLHSDLIIRHRTWHTLLQLWGTDAHTPPATPQVNYDEHCLVSWILERSEESYLLNRMVFSPTRAALYNQQLHLSTISIPGPLHTPKNSQGPKAAEQQKAEFEFHPNPHRHFTDHVLPWWGPGAAGAPREALQTCWAPWWRAAGGCSGGSWAGWTGGGRAGSGRNTLSGTSAQKTETDPCLRNKNSRGEINKWTALSRVRPQIQLCLKQGKADSIKKRDLGKVNSVLESSTSMYLRIRRHSNA